MKVSASSVLTAGITLVTASAIAVAPTVIPPPAPAPKPTVHLSAAQVELTAAFNPFSVTDWLERIVIPPSLTTPFPAPPSGAPPVITATNIDSTVKAIYFAVEPWVRYGFQLAEYALGWVPYVGWLAPQVMIFYNLGERIVRSAVFNGGQSQCLM